MSANVDGNATAPSTKRRPEEDWKDYVKRLERARLQAIGEHRAKEADALEKVVRAEGDEVDPAIRIEAEAKRAYANVFLARAEEMRREEF